MYEDDGKSRLSLEQGRFELLKFRAEHEGDSLSLALHREGGAYDGRPASRQLTLVVHNWDADVDEALFDGKPVRVLHQRRARKLIAQVDWDHGPAKLEINPQPQPEKAVVYQVMTRLFGNRNDTNKPWGTIEENGVGKFADFTDEALAGIRELGTTHIWYTGVPHHALVRDYTDYGISDDDPDVIKGRAGSPYAVKDYYNVNPDLAVDPARRLEEFEALIERTHANGMGVIIDIVPNHVARNYESISRPAGVEDFGASDDTSVEWARDNNFYTTPPLSGRATTTSTTWSAKTSGYRTFPTTMRRSAATRTRSSTVVSTSRRPSGPATVRGLHSPRSMTGTRPSR
jgi:hypothetical protein